MITMPTLHQTLEDILLDPSLDDFAERRKFIVPLQGNWYVPTYDTQYPYATWCGYVIMGTKPTQRATQAKTIVQKNVKQRFRVVFVGPQAEEFSNQTLLWDERDDVRVAFAKNCYAQLCYDERAIYTKIYEQEGQNSTLIWAVDMAAMSHFALDTHQTPWVPIGG